MLDTTAPASQATAIVRLTLSVTYLLNGDSPTDLIECLRRRCAAAIGNGLLTGETAADVEAHTIDVSASPPSDLSEDDIADFMLRRIEDGEMDLEVIPARLASYGLMAPEDFVAEMRERMELASVMEQGAEG